MQGTQQFQPTSFSQGYPQTQGGYNPQQIRGLSPQQVSGPTSYFPQQANDSMSQMLQTFMQTLPLLLMVGLMGGLAGGMSS